MESGSVRGDGEWGAGEIRGWDRGVGRESWRRRKPGPGRAEGGGR